MNLYIVLRKDRVWTAATYDSLDQMKSEFEITPKFAHFLKEAQPGDWLPLDWLEAESVIVCVKQEPYVTMTTLKG
jgi:hypothetical protein